MNIRITKILALIVFVFLPFGGFYLGMQYQKTITKPATAELITDHAIPQGAPNPCPWDTQTCPDGTVVIRVPPSCTYLPCPQPTAPPTPTAAVKRELPTVIRTSISTSSWQTYHGTYDGITVTFRYPPGYEIFDQDSSTQLSIFQTGHPYNGPHVDLWRNYVEVPYRGEPFETWFAEHVLYNNSGSREETLTVQSITLNNKPFLYVQRTYNDIDNYYSIQKNIPFQFINHGLPDDQFFSLIDSFTIISGKPFTDR